MVSFRGDGVKWNRNDYVNVDYDCNAYKTIHSILQYLST